MATASRLPPEFMSLYRLFLRGCSTSVLHHRQATRNLRSLYRPTFDIGALVLKQLGRAANGTASQQKLEQWLDIWNSRMDDTLALLHNSSTSRGLPHRLTKNLAYLVLSEKQRLLQIERSYKAWIPNLPPNSPTYTPKLPQKNRAKVKARRDFDDKAWDQLKEVIAMAEGRDGVSLGRIILKRPAKRVRKT